MPSKVRLKWSSLEIEYERDESISLEDLAALIKMFEDSSMTKFTPVASQPTESAIHIKANVEGPKITLHMNSVAQYMGVKKGPELVVAAAAYLQIIQGKESFSRMELLISMREATKFYMQSMGTNLDRTLKSLVGSKFNQIASDKYCLKQEEYSSAEAALADAA
jgi:hypothetical protein